MRKLYNCLWVGISVLFLLVFAAGFASAETISNWELVYETNVSGQVITGSWAALADAVEAGASVKVVYYYSGTNNKNVVSATAVLVDRVKNLCYAYWDGNSMGADNGDGIIRLRETLLAYMLLRTDGTKESINRSTTTGSPASHAYETLPMKWYVSR